MGGGLRIGRLSIKKSAYGWSIFFSRPEKVLKARISNHMLEDLEPKVGDKASIKLNVGGGKGHPAVPGWTVVGVRSHADIVLDISRSPLPYPDNSVDLIFCSHTLEHIVPQRLGFVLSQFHRVLKKPHGVLRISVPDIAIAIDAYQQKDMAFFEHSGVAPNFPNAPLGGLFASWCYSTRLDANEEETNMHGHVHCFDCDYMIWCLSRAGFQNIWKSGPNDSIVRELQGLAFDRHINESLFIEAMPEFTSEVREEIRVLKVSDLDWSLRPDIILAADWVRNNFNLSHGYPKYYQALEKNLNKIEHEKQKFEELRKGLMASIGIYTADFDVLLMADSCSLAPLNLHRGAIFLAQEIGEVRVRVIKKESIGTEYASSAVKLEKGHYANRVKRILGDKALDNLQKSLVSGIEGRGRSKA